MERGRWLDPRDADMALATWAEEFLSLARRLSPLPRRRTAATSTGTFLEWPDVVELAEAHGERYRAFI